MCICWRKKEKKNEKGEQARNKMKAQPTTGPITLHPHCADMFNLELDSDGSPFFTSASAASTSFSPSLLLVDAFCAGILEAPEIAVRAAAAACLGSLFHSVFHIFSLSSSPFLIPWQGDEDGQRF
jgi:hypothetical protein